MQKRRNDVKVRTTLLLALPDEHQLRFSKYKTAQKLLAAILKTFGGNEATKKTKKNQLKSQYGNFRANGSETLEQTFNRLQAIVSHLESDLDTISLDDVYNHLKVYEPEVQKKLELNSQNMAFISSAKNNSRNGEVNTASIPTVSTQVSPASANVAAANISLDTTYAYIASQSNGSQIKYEDINQIDEDDIEEMDIKWNMALLSMKADRFWKKTKKKISIQGTDVAGFDKSEVECFNCQKICHFARECRALRSQDRGRRENYRQENHASVADEEAPTEFSLMAKSSSDSEVFDNSLCSKTCRKNTDSLNSKITELSKKLSDIKTNLYHYKLGLSQVKAKLVEFKNQEIKFCEKIKGLEFKVESKTNRIECITNELEMIKKEKEGLYSKVTGFQSPSKDLDTLLGSQRPSPSIESNLNDLQNNSSSVSENGESTSSILSKPKIKFVKAVDSPLVIKTSKDETVRKPSVKYAELYRKTSKSSNVRGNQRNWNNLKSQQLGKNFLMKNNACFNCGDFDHMSYDCVVRTQFEVPRVPIVNWKFPTVSRKFPTGNSKVSTADLRNKGKLGCSRHMTGNISYLSDYEPYDGGYMSFEQGGCKITECIVLGRNFKLKHDTNVLLRTTRQHNMYSIDLNNFAPYKDLTCLVVKASADESMLWHKRLGHLNFKTMNGLVRHNLIKGLPSKCFDNDHTCVACLKGKQHKASCKTKLVNSVSKPLHTLHMDLFGPTSLSSLNHKWYCLVVTDDFSRFTWTLFLKTKDETSGILRNFVTEIENLKELKVKIIKCDNGGEFRNKEMNDFYSRKGIKREFSNARTPQQNGIAERRNMTLIEAARTMLADAKLPVTFWAEAVNTTCYVQNRVLVNKSQNKTPYEIFNGRTPAIGFLKPFRCHVMILNTLDHLGKFEAKGDKGLGLLAPEAGFTPVDKGTLTLGTGMGVSLLSLRCGTMYFGLTAYILGAITLGLAGLVVPLDGHFARDCRSFGNASVENAQSNNGANPKRNGCLECGAPGNFKRDCPKLKDKDGGKVNAP
nr:putative ribonuclease H-like domain-containing protein [Tanacetum cinerariifolium]